MIPQFKIDDSVPLPQGEEPEELIEEILPEEAEDTRWVPFKPHQKKCRNSKHNHVNGRCLLCGDVYPCPSGKCGHLDCADPTIAGLDCEGNGTPVHEFVTVVDKKVKTELDDLEGEFNGAD